MRTVVNAIVVLVTFLAAAPAAQPPAMTVTLLGTGNPRPSLDRFGPSSLVEAGEGRILIDAGRGVTQRLFQIGSARLLAGTDVVLLTHLHSDHVVGLPDLWLTGWIFGRNRPLRVIGPPGTAEMVRHLEAAFAFDVRMRRDLDERLPAEGGRIVGVDAAPGVILDEGGMKAIAFEVDHLVVKPAWGYRIEAGGRSVGFSGDTRASDSLVRHARGVDVLVHEVISPEVERLRAKVPDPAAIERIIAHHITPEEAGRIFTRVAPRLAVYSHIVPSPATARDLIGPTRTTYEGRLEAGEDLMTIAIGREITVGRRAVVPDR
jgi:ribonuclease Z